MINTQNSKADHYTKGSFSIGTGPDVVVVLGSCRVVPYVNYLDWLNASNRFTIHLINVVNFYYDAADAQVDPIENARTFETNPALLETLKTCKWFIHEHTENFGMFNTARDAEKNIYQFGMKPEVDISIPNFNNTFVLFQELVNYDEDLRNELKRGLSGEPYGCVECAARRIKKRGLVAIDKFLSICAKTDLPEFGAAFKDEWTKIRYFWTGNHISAYYTQLIFHMMNARFLHLEIPEAVQLRMLSEDMYATPCTPVTKYDVEAYGLTWPQAVEELKVP